MKNMKDVDMYISDRYYLDKLDIDSICSNTSIHTGTFVEKYSLCDWSILSRNPSVIPLLEKNFDNVAVLQEDIVASGEAYQYETNGLLTEWTAGMITWNQWQTQKGRDAVAGMDIYYPDYIKKYPSMDVNKSKEALKPKTTKKKDGKEATPKDNATEE